MLQLSELKIKKKTAENCLYFSYSYIIKGIKLQAFLSGKANGNFKLLFVIRTKKDLKLTCPCIGSSMKNQINFCENKFHISKGDLYFCDTMSYEDHLRISNVFLYTRLSLCQTPTDQNTVDSRYLELQGTL